MFAIISYFMNWGKKIDQLGFKNDCGGSIYNSEYFRAEDAVWGITGRIDCDCQVIFVDYFFDQVIGAVLVEVIFFAIECHIVGSPNIARTYTSQEISKITI